MQNYNNMYNEDGDTYCCRCGYVGWAIKRKRRRRHFTYGPFLGICLLLLGKLNITKDSEFICPMCGSDHLTYANEAIKSYKRPQHTKTLDEQARDFYRQMYGY